VQPETPPFALGSLNEALSGAPGSRPMLQGDLNDPSERRADPQQLPLFKKGTCCRFT
jgi:hypothetical protein